MKFPFFPVFHRIQIYSCPNITLVAAAAGTDPRDKKTRRVWSKLPCKIEEHSDLSGIVWNFPGYGEPWSTYMHADTV